MWHIIWNELYDSTTLPVICLFCSCVLAACYWKRLPNPMQVLAIFLFFNLFIEIAARIASHVWRQNLPLLHLYTLGEYLLLSAFYWQILDRESVFRRYFNWIVGGVFLLVVLNSVFLQKLTEFNSYAKTLVQILIILYALDYAFRFSEQSLSDTVLNRMLRLINAAILVYYCGSLFVFMSSQFEIKTQGALRILWHINTVLNLIFHIIVFYALWIITFPPQKLSSSSEQASSS